MIILIYHVNVTKEYIQDQTKNILIAVICTIMGILLIIAMGLKYWHGKKQEKRDRKLLLELHKNLAGEN